MLLVIVISFHNCKTKTKIKIIKEKIQLNVIKTKKKNKIRTFTFLRKKKHIKKNKKNAVVIYDKIFIYFKLINKISNKNSNTLEILYI